MRTHLIISSMKAATVIIMIIFISIININSIVFSGPATSNNHYILVIEEDMFYNWDYSVKDRNPEASDADWPLTILFWGYAEVDKVKNNYFGLWSILALSRYAYLDDGYGWAWDSDRGRKAHYEFDPPLDITCEDVVVHVEDVFVHIKFYANSSTDYNYNDAWGYYVLASTHLDDWPDEDWAGFSSMARDLIAMYLSNKGLSVINPWANFYNADPVCRVGTGDRHFNLHDGWAAAVYIPP